VRLHIEILEVLVQIGTTALRQAIAIAHPQGGGTGGKAGAPTIANPCPVLARPSRCSPGSAARCFSGRGGRRDSRCTGYDRRHLSRVLRVRLGRLFGAAVSRCSKNSE
jgi:hypothetical protein